jgi:hypothetical protein
MSDLSIQLHWQRAEPALLTGKYSNAHTVQFNSDCDIQVDAAPDWGGDPATGACLGPVQLPHDDLSRPCGEGGMAGGEL